MMFLEEDGRFVAQGNISNSHLSIETVYGLVFLLKIVSTGVCRTKIILGVNLTGIHFQRIAHKAFTAHLTTHTT